MTFLKHIIFKRCHLQHLTSRLFFGFSLKFSFKIALFWVSLLLVSCEQEVFEEPFIAPCEQGLGASSNLISKIPHRVQIQQPVPISPQITSGYKFLGLSSSNLFLFGLMGIHKSPSFGLWVEDIHGQIMWSKSFGMGYTRFGMFYQDYVLISGSLILSPIGISKVYEHDGNELDKKFPDNFHFRNSYVNASGELYLSNSAYLSYANPTKVLKLSPEFDIIQSNSINFPVHAFAANQDGHIAAYYVDETKKENGVVMVDSNGQEKWNIPLPYQMYGNDAKIFTINDQKFGLVKAECKVIPCGFELVYYEFGINGELLNPGQIIVSSMPMDMVINSPTDKKENFYLGDYGNFIKDVLVLEDEVFVVFEVLTKNYQAIMIKGTQSTSLEYWWDPKSESNKSLSHVQFIKNNGELEWKTFFGDAICTFKLDKNLTFNPCF